MSQIFFSLAILACPVGMGLMMFLMMRGNSQSSSAPMPDSEQGAELARLRAEIDQLNAAQRDCAPKTDSSGTRR